MILDELTCASPRRLLEDLARIGAALAKHDRVRPEVELHLASGQSVRGRIVSLADGAMAIVQVAGTTVAFVRVDQIAAVTVADASVLVKAGVADAPVPSKLELQRQAAARADGLATAFGRPVTLQLAGASELDDDGRRAIGVVLPVVAEVMTAIATDELGRDAVKALAAIELGSASTGEVRLDGKRLVIRAPKLLSEQYTHATLRAAIEKLL